MIDYEGRYRITIESLLTPTYWLGYVIRSTRFTVRL